MTALSGDPGPGRDGADAAWVARTRAALDDSVDALDAATLSALNRARQRALAQARSARPAWWWPAAFAAAASVALALVLVRPAAPPTPPDPGTMALDARDLELVAAGELELYDDWEFYAWLASQPVDG